MRITETLAHSDEVSGTYVADDGTKCHWTEGRSSWITCVRPDGTKIEFPAAGTADLREDDPDLCDALIDAIENGVADGRAMTTEEEEEWTAARYG